MATVVMCDFDGTIVDVDTCVLILDKFGDPDWRRIDDQYERGELTLQDAIQREFSTIRADEQLILRDLAKAVHIRPNFGRLVDHCKNRRIPLIIVSAGLDFVIQHYLQQNGWEDFITVHAPKPHGKADASRYAFPVKHYPDSINFKHDLVRQYTRNGHRVLFVGNGLADFHAAKAADQAFAIKGSRLAQMLSAEGLRHETLDDFNDVIEAIAPLH
jgi:2,3-diketo-5-methylthio-1-phosphopentane phosphatase